MSGHKRRRTNYVPSDDQEDQEEETLSEMWKRVPKSGEFAYISSEHQKEDDVSAEQSYMSQTSPPRSKQSITKSPHQSSTTKPIQKSPNQLHHQLHQSISPSITITNDIAIISSSPSVVVTAPLLLQPSSSSSSSSSRPLTNNTVATPIIPPPSLLLKPPIQVSVSPSSSSTPVINTNNTSSSSSSSSSSPVTNYLQYKQQLQYQQHQLEQQRYKQQQQQQQQQQPPQQQQQQQQLSPLPPSFHPPPPQLLQPKPPQPPSAILPIPSPIIIPSITTNVPINVSNPTMNYLVYPVNIDKWNEHYDTLKTFIDTHQKLPQNHYPKLINERRIAEWSTLQLVRAKKIQNLTLQYLDSQEAMFERNFMKLLEYRIHNNHEIWPSSKRPWLDENERMLGTWLSNVQQAYTDLSNPPQKKKRRKRSYIKIKITSIQIMKLKGIGFPLNKDDQIWLEKYYELQKFISVKLKWPKIISGLPKNQKRNPEQVYEHSLAQWISLQRSRKKNPDKKGKKLTKELIHKLDMLGIQWQLRPNYVRKNKKTKKIKEKQRFSSSSGSGSGSSRPPSPPTGTESSPRSSSKEIEEEDDKNEIGKDKKQEQNLIAGTGQDSSQFTTTTTTDDGYLHHNLQHRPKTTTKV